VIFGQICGDSEAAWQMPPVFSPVISSEQGSVDERSRFKGVGSRRDFHNYPQCLQSDTTGSYSHASKFWRAANIRATTTARTTTARKTAAPGFSEAQAIEQAKGGDSYAFEQLYGLHKRRVYSLCLRMTGNTAEAEDLTQEAFLQLYRKIGTFRGESAFSTWLHRLSVNVVLMHLRKKGLPEVSLEETLEPQQEDGPKKDIGARDTVLAGSIDRVNLERAIENLPPGYRIIFVLHDIEGYEHNEIAEMMGCSIGNSKSQLHKARMKLRDLLKQSRVEKAARR
jgi:RNA polymerase sigma-70 factor (ECF subfamily)